MDDAPFRERYGPAAMVTGASSGIGRAFAERLATLGFDLALTARRGERLEELAGRLSSDHGVRCTPLVADLADPGAPDSLLEATAGLDVGLLVSNAGFGFKGPHEDVDAQGLREMLMVNCNAPLQLTRGFIPRLKARGRGGIILTSSVEGLIGCPFSAAYAASKALVIALGEALWAELKPDGVDVLTLCPGATATEAAAKQGVDLSKLSDVMSAEAVADFALERIRSGPTLIASDHYQAVFDHLLALPRREALTAMAASMRR